MLVKKINPEWQPSEKPGIKVGETIEMTNPRQLILTGMVRAVNEDGTEISTFDLYGVITKDERSEFEEYQKIKRMEASKVSLEKEAIDLKAQLEADKKTATEVVVKIQPTYQELVKQAQDKGVWKVNMSKRQIEEALK